MASGDLYEVERIVDKRRNKKGKWEYLIRWKGYGSKEDTWEPEHHLLHCEEFIDHFNSLQIHSHKQPKIPKSTANGHSAATENSRARAEVRKKKSGSEPAVGVRVGTILGIPGGGSAAVHRQRKVGEGLGRHALRDKMSKAMTFKTPSLGAPRFVDPMRKPYNGLQNGDVEPHMYRTASRSHRASSDRVNGDQKEIDTTELDSPLADGKMQLHSSAKRKMAEEKCYVFDKRLRYNVRQNESNCRFRDIVVRKEDGFTHILLSSQTTDNNALTPEIMKEVCRALGNAACDDSKLLLLSSVGTVFCSGLEPSYLIGRLSTDRRKESSRIADAVRDFVLALIRFKKPIVVAINGPALGLGASILPLCDVVWASERAWFQTPCAALHLTPSGCSSYTFPQILGVALANEMLFCGRKLTAQEACSRGLVSQVFWPTTFNQEVMLRVKEMASCNAVVLEESKCLVRSILLRVLEEVNEKECQMLKQLWCSTKGLEALFSYLHNKAYEK
ncbi:chromodomain Y-like protein 2 [Nerophis ophidion]|uniref:chromodomain Y-like protein 2 n=1 Tax=Nerophis ophidion TaxID=159077 RepID=UPI002AE02388|nr:chromodomain Y-like protein 2 [Nerophis ophidion]XP_061736836.1 chromodomain Y-like protein 2 [Nerophis ophidion]XP_061736845.1 chromodomain Y-like protein 2 [Nerophis ophidion]